MQQGYKKTDLGPRLDCWGIPSFTSDLHQVRLLVREANLALFEEADFFAILLQSVIRMLVLDPRDAHFWP